MTEAEDGFLSEPFDQLIGVIRAKYARHRNLLLRVNRFAVTTQHALVIHRESNPERYAAVLYARTLASTQGGALLLARGMVAQARTVFRMALDTLFALSAMARDPTIVDKLIEGHAAEQKRAARNMGHWKDPELRKISDAEIASGRVQQYLNHNAVTVSTLELARIADLEDWYRTVYMVLSWSVHGSPIDLDHHVVTNGAGYLVEFRNEPEVEDQESWWLLAVEIVLKAMTALGKVFPGVRERSIDQYVSELRELVHESAGQQGTAADAARR